MKKLEVGTKGTWWASFGRVLADAERDWKPVDALFICGEAPPDGGKPAREGTAAVSYLIVEVSTVPLAATHLELGFAADVYRVVAERLSR